MMDRVAIYCRVSGQEQLRDGYSLGEQETRLRMYCESHGWIISNVYTDGAQSGSNMDRPALQQLIRDAEERRITKVCVYKLDRLSRSQKDTLYLIEDIFIKNNVSFVSMSETLDTSTPLGMAMIGILSVFAQLERSNITERMTMGRDARAKQGKYKGGGHIPIGFRRSPEGTLVTDEYEAQTIRDVFSEYIKGKSASAIAYKFNQESFSGSRTWNASKVNRTLQQPLYIGMQRWKGELIPVAGCPTIITEDTFNAAQAEISRRSAKNIRPVTQQKHVTLLGGLIWCGKCGNRYMSFNDANKGNPCHRYYCVTKTKYGQHMIDHKCESKGWRSDRLDDLVIDEVKKLSIDPDLMNSGNTESTKIKRSAILSRISEIERSLDRLIDLYTVEGIDIRSITKRSQELKSEKEHLTDQLSSIEDSIPDKSDIIKALRTFDQLTTEPNYDRMDLYDVIRKLIRSVTINDSSITIEWNI